MTPEETARYHADRPGYELIDFAEVGLPIFKIYMVASLLQHTPLAPIYEFVLRAVRCKARYKMGPTTGLKTGQSD
jgi:hypothetical protein